MSDFNLNQGDTASPLFETLINGDPTDETDTFGNPINAVNLQGATVKITIAPIRGGTPIVNAHAANNLQVGTGTDGSKGDVSYGEAANPWGTATQTSGDFKYRWEVTYADGTIQSFPNDGWRILTITPDNSASAAVYISREELKKTLMIDHESYPDADIDVAITAAARGLEAAFGTIWTVESDTVRYYRAYGRTVLLGDVLSVSAIGLDYTWPWPSDEYPYSSDWGAGDYSTALSPSDYQLLPTRNGAAGNGEPYQRLELVRGSSFYNLPSGMRAVRITGTFGWLSVPAGVRAANTIIATRILRRARDAPFGIHSVGVEGATMTAQSMARDPEIMFMVNAVRRPRSLVV